MSVEMYAALALFCLVSSITPGPNNLMLMSSGATFGFRRTIPHLLGVAIGFVVMVILVGIGLTQLFDLFPVSYQILKVISVAYLLFLAYKIAHSSDAVKNNANTIAEQDEGDENNQPTPISFWQAVAFQWVNPKAWTMALTAISVYAPSQQFAAVLVVAGIFGMINLPSISAWTMLGQELQRVLTSQRRLQRFNWTMATLLVLSLYPVVFI
ncbi:LysE family translocator [Thalassotalea mangrovi]|uniref:LysE family translocator n=1 Tax=Thalassotalea mangrovi TaxID=2572245 RepID=A0A4U1B1U9_9GAMM|nr:LysE family translocator [Thalassotalea mangrovi]TKB43207.1 LysE family translocator [Thalassotalea mangrovi]